MKRFIWIATIFGGGIMLLMVGAIMLQRQVPPRVDDLRTPVKGICEGFAEGDYDKISQYALDVPKEMYQKIFDDGHGGNPDRSRKFKGVLSSMAAFPSVRFPEAKPEQVEVDYDVVDGRSEARARVVFVPSKEGGYAVKSFRFPIGSMDNVSSVPIVFQSGDNLTLVATVDKLFDTLMGDHPDEFRSLMMLTDKSGEETRKVFDDIRAQVMACRSDRLRKLVPAVGALPRGTQWFRVIALGRVDDRRIFMDLVVVPGKTVQIRGFRAGLAPETAETPAPK